MSSEMTNIDGGEGEGLYPIRTVSSLTGVNPITLRAWERRYGLIKPRRTDTQRRLYTRHDIDRIHQILTHLEAGIPISQISEDLLRQPQQEGNTASDHWGAQRQHMIIAITRFDEEALNRVYNDALAHYPIDIVTRKLIMPLLEELGRRWLSAEGSIAEEHFFSVYLRHKLGARFHYQGAESRGPRILAACLPGEWHDIGLMLFALAAQAQGYRFILLGANTPLADLHTAARHARAKAILLSATLVDTLTEQLDAIARLRNLAGIPVFIGGASSMALRDAVVAAGAIPLGNDIPQGLRLLDQKLAPLPGGDQRQ